MRLRRAVDSEKGVVVPLKSQITNIETGSRLPGHGYTDEVGDRAAAGQDAARLRRKAHELDEPVENLVLDQCRGLIEAGQVGVDAGRQHVGEHAQGRTVPLRPAKET